MSNVVAIMNMKIFLIFNESNQKRRKYIALNVFLLHQSEIGIFEKRNEVNDVKQYFIILSFSAALRPGCCERNILSPWNFFLILLLKQLSFPNMHCKKRKKRNSSVQSLTRKNIYVIDGIRIEYYALEIVS